MWKRLDLDEHIDKDVGSTGQIIIGCPTSIREEEQPRRLLYWTGLEVGKVAAGDAYPALICEPTYCLRKQSVVARNSSKVEVLTHKDDPTCSTIPGLDGWQLFGALQTSVRKSEPLMGFNTYEHAELSDHWLRRSTASPPDSKNPHSTMEALQRAWSIFTAQVFNLYFRVLDDSSLKGTVVAMRERLVIQNVQFWLAEACLICLVGLSLTLTFLGSHDLVPRDPSSILGLASILSGSRHFMQELSGCGKSSDEQLRGILSSTRYRTFVRDQPPWNARTSPFEILPERISTGTDYSMEWRRISASSKISWYRSSSTTFLHKFGMPLLLLATIVTLELLLQGSQVSNGLCDVKSPDSHQHFAWTLIPAGFTTALAFLVCLQLSDAKIFTPYSTLGREPEGATATVARRPFTKLATLYQWRHFEGYLALATISALISTFLTIVVSGLLSSIEFPLQQQVSLQQRDWFQHSIDRAGGSLQTGLILTGDLPFSSFTYDNLAIAHPDNVPLANGSLKISSPSVRGNMNCSIVPPEKLSNIFVTRNWSSSVYLTSASTIPTDAQRIVHLQLPHEWDYCGGFGTLSGNGYWDSALTVYTASRFSSLEILAPGNGYFGGITLGLAQPDLNIAGIPSSSCPLVVGAFGHTKEAKINQMSAFACSPFTQKVMAKVNLKLPGLEIQRPPVVEERTAEIAYVTFFQGVGDPMMPLMNQALTDARSTSDVFDPFMRILVLGSRGTPAKDLSGEANQNRLLDAMNHTYGISVAQLMDHHRVPISSQDQSFLKGKLFESGHYRLFQSAVATHLLVAILGVILVLIVATILIMKTKEVLPKNPCSIAAAASLLADSDFLGTMPQESERMSDKELLALFDGYRFIIGWWAGKEGEVARRRYGIDFGTADNLR